MGLFSDATLITATAVAVTETLNISDFSYKILTICCTIAGLWLARWSRKQAIRLKKAEIALRDEELKETIRHNKAMENRMPKK